mgnify:CR=1 FL=1
MYQIAPSGWLIDIDHYPSPNFNQRPADTEIDLLVIHAISLPPGQFGGQAIIDFFLNQLDSNAHPYFEHIRDLQVSSHFLIDRCGKLIQFVATQHRAWHAGQSCFDGKPNCNDYSVGIELEGTADQAFTDAQYQQLVRLTLSLQSYYPAITMERISGHQHIAPDRKWDPGPHFNWSRYLKELQNAKTKNYGN